MIWLDRFCHDLNHKNCRLMDRVGDQKRELKLLKQENVDLSKCVCMSDLLMANQILRRNSSVSDSRQPDETAIHAICYLC